jgi:hypothetical protein
VYPRSDESPRRPGHPRRARLSFVTTSAISDLPVFALGFTCCLPILLLVCVRSFVRASEQKRMTLLLLLGYFARIGIQTFARSMRLHLFNADGLDAGTYERGGAIIQKMWDYGSIHYVTADELPMLMRTTLPQNLFATVFYMNGEPTGLGGTAVIALIACLTCLNIYMLAIELGAPSRVAFSTTAFICFLPTFMFYTSDMFKEGIVYGSVFLVLGSALRLARTFSLLQLGLGCFGLLCIWLTRFYLTFFLPLPLLLGCLGARSGSWGRSLVVALTIVLLAGSVAAYTSLADRVTRDASDTFAQGTSRDVIDSNVETGGSGVSFEGSSPFASLPLKVVYTLFSPFPWESGSLGLHLAKVEVLAWYYMAYRAILAAREMWRRRRTDLLIILSFVVPTTACYSVMFANIGLNIRERIAIVMAVSMVAAVSWRSTKETASQGVALPVSGAA